MSEPKLKLYVFQAEDAAWPIFEGILCRDCMISKINWYDGAIDPDVYEEADIDDVCENCGEKEG